MTAMKERAARQLSSLPTTVVSRPAAERVYQHVKGAWPSAYPALASARLFDGYVCSDCARVLVLQLLSRDMWLTRVSLRAAAANLGSVDAWAQLGTAQISLGRARCEELVI